jgi:hypothetical protein
MRRKTTCAARPRRVVFFYFLAVILKACLFLEMRACLIAGFLRVSRQPHR